MEMELKLELRLRIEIETELKPNWATGLRYCLTVFIYIVIVIFIGTLITASSAPFVLFFLFCVAFPALLCFHVSLSFDLFVWLRTQFHLTYFSGFV